MLLGDLERLVDALLDRDGRHDDHEFCEAETLVQLEDRAEVNVGLARPRLHFDGEVAGRERRRRRQTVAELNILQVDRKSVVSGKSVSVSVDLGGSSISQKKQ